MRVDDHVVVDLLMMSLPLQIDRSCISGDLELANLEQLQHKDKWCDLRCLMIIASGTEAVCTFSSTPTHSIRVYNCNQGSSSTNEESSSSSQHVGLA